MESEISMLYVDIPTRADIDDLIRVRADFCLSIYLATTPETQNVGASRIAFGNLVREGLRQMAQAGLDKRRLAILQANCDELADDDLFWTYQARSLAVLATPDRLRTFRLATAVADSVAVADRFRLRPLLRAVAFPQTAFILALSENAARLIEIFPDMPPQVVRSPDLPKSAADAVGRASVNNLTQNTRIANAEGQTVLLGQYVRKVSDAVRAALVGHDAPLILAATHPIEPMFRAVNNTPHLLAEGLVMSPDRMTEASLATAARTLLDGHYRSEIAAAHAEWAQRRSSGRALTKLGEIARAATWGAVDLLMVDIDAMLPGTIDTDGKLILAEDMLPGTYDVLDEIAGRAILTGARFLAVRSGDLPDGVAIAATLRHPL